MILTEELITMLKKVCKTDSFAELLIRDHYRGNADKRVVSLMLSWDERDATGERERRNKEIPAEELGRTLQLNDDRTSKSGIHFYGRINAEYLRSLVRAMKPGDVLSARIVISDSYGFCDVALSRKDGRSNSSVEVYRAITSASGPGNYFGN
jgi:hypothetical protein